MPLSILGILKTYVLWNISYHTWFLGTKPPYKAIGHLRNDLQFVIYQRRNETFFVIKSFIWRRGSHDNKVLFSFENRNWAAVASDFCCSGQSKEILNSMSKNIENIFTFRLCRGIEKSQCNFGSNYKVEGKHFHSCLVM